MAFVRVVRPGEPVRPELFVDLGIARGRITGPAASLGGPLEQQASAWAGKRIRQESAERPVKGERCLAVMRTGGTCMSMAGHSEHHRARP